MRKIPSAEIIIVAMNRIKALNISDPGIGTKVWIVNPTQITYKIKETTKAQLKQKKAAHETGNIKKDPAPKTILIRL